MDFTMIYEDDFGMEVDTEQKYRCPNCGWIGLVEEMDPCADCGDEYDAIYSDYCCPECLTFHLFIDRWKKVNDQDSSY